MLFRKLSSWNVFEVRDYFAFFNNLSQEASLAFLYYCLALHNSKWWLESQKSDSSLEHTVGNLYCASVGNSSSSKLLYLSWSFSLGSSLNKHTENWQITLQAHELLLVSIFSANFCWCSNNYSQLLCQNGWWFGVHNSSRTYTMMPAIKNHADNGPMRWYKHWTRFS